jgi:hypothetical protein
MSAVTIYQRRLAAIRDRTAAAVAAEFDRLPDLHDTQAEPFARKASGIVRAGQLLAAGTTNQYIARAAKIRPLRLDPAAVTGQGARPVDPIELYRRPFGIVWKALADGEPLDVATRMGRDRALILAATDVWLASRAAAAVIDKATSKITGWVRVADAGACDLCSAADGLPMDQAGDLAGHPNCGCTSSPTFGDDAGDSEPSDPDAFDVHEHDELGPVLYEAGQHFMSA